MTALRKIEGQIQEIIFFLSVIASFSLFLSGIFYLALQADSLVYIMGQFGVAIQQALFSSLGYAYFYLAVMALHMGYIANFHIFSFKDIKKEYAVLAYSAIAHLIILALFASALSVIQIYLDIPSRDNLTYGSGGLIGLAMGGSVYSLIGVYGSLISIILVIAITSVIADFVELPALFNAIRKSGQFTLQSAKKGLSNTQSGFMFLLKDNSLVEATSSASQNSKNWMSRANNLVTDHFHIYTDFVNPSKKIKKEEKKSTTTKQAKTKKRAKVKTSKKVLSSKKKTSRKK